MSDQLLTIRGLAAAYEEENMISGVDLEMKRGEILCIVGESGSGKSTLIKAIHGMSDLKITAGSIVFDGSELVSMPQRERRRLMGKGIGLIPQQPGASFNPIRRFDRQFRETLSSHGMDYDEEEIIRFMAQIGLDSGREILRNRPYQMSGGMNQRIAIAAAVMLEPKLLLCDEATSALDVPTSVSVVSKLLEIREELGTSILMVTHHLGIAHRMADRIGVMQKGKMIEFGERDQIFYHPENEYTRALIRDIPKLKKEV